MAFAAIAGKGLATLQSALAQFKKNEKDSVRLAKKEEAKRLRNEQSRILRERKERAKSGSVLSLDFADPSVRGKDAAILVVPAPAADPDWSKPFITTGDMDTVIAGAVSQNYSLFLNGFPKCDLFKKKGKAVGDLRSIDGIDCTVLRKALWGLVSRAPQQDVLLSAEVSAVAPHNEKVQKKIKAWVEFDALRDSRHMC